MELTINLTHLDTPELRSLAGLLTSAALNGDNDRDVRVSLIKSARLATSDLAKRGGEVGDLDTVLSYAETRLFSPYK